MIVISRRLARQFRARLRWAVSERRGPPPPVCCTAGPEGLTMHAGRGDILVLYHEAGARAPASVIFPANLLADIEGNVDEPVTLEQTGDTGRAQWSEGGAARSIAFEAIPAEHRPTFPELPRRFLTMPAEFRMALAEAARSTAAPSGRPALTRVLLRGKDGSVIATDGLQLLVQGGFRFPWSGDVLVAPLAVGGPRDRMDQESSLGLGRTRQHVALRQGPWTFLLAIDSASRFPVIDNVIPRPGATRVRLQLSDEDVQALAAALAKLPGRGEEHEAITLDLQTPPVVRVRGEEASTTELVLARSTVSGPPLRLSVNRRLLLRALQLGFREFQLQGADKPLLCHAEQRTFVFMPLDKVSALPPSAETLRVPAPEPATPEPVAPEERSAPAMPPPERNGPRPDPEPRAAPPNERPTLEELITEAENLRSLLQDAAGRSARLVAALKQQRRRSRAVEAAVASLRQLQLGS